MISSAGKAAGVDRVERVVVVGVDRVGRHRHDRVAVRGEVLRQVVVALPVADLRPARDRIVRALGEVAPGEQAVAAGARLDAGRVAAVHEQDHLPRTRALRQHDRALERLLERVARPEGALTGVDGGRVGHAAGARDRQLQRAGAVLELLRLVRTRFERVRWAAFAGAASAASAPATPSASSRPRRRRLRTGVGDGDAGTATSGRERRSFSLGQTGPGALRAHRSEGATLCPDHLSILSTEWPKRVGPAVGNLAA